MNKRMFMMGLLCALTFSACKETTVDPGTPLLSNSSPIYYTKVSSDGTKSTIYRINSDGTGKQQISDNDSSRITGSPYGSTMVYTTWKDDGAYKVMRAGADGANPQFVAAVPDFLQPQGVLNYAVLSPALNKILYTVDVPGGGNGSTKVFTINPDGTNNVFIWDDAPLESLPTISPDGGRVTYVKKDPGGSIEGILYIADANSTDGGEVSIEVTHVAGFDGLDWSLDGTKVACVRDKNLLGQGKMNLQIANTDFSGSITFPQFEALMPVFSPDGAKIACMAANTIKIIDLATKNVQTLDIPQPAAYPQWSLDGKSILFTSLDAGTPAMYGTLRVVDIETGTVTTLDENVYKGFWKK